MAQPKATRSDQDISAIMRKVHSNDTTPEMVFRKALWARGVRYRVSPAAIPGKPDVVIASKRIAVFIDGDFWHGNQWRRRKRASLEDQFTHTRRREYWLAKIRRNMQRDCQTTAALLADGWTVLRFWESDIRHDLDKCVQMTVDIANGGGHHHTAASLVSQKTVAEFFAGSGLMRLGLEGKGWSVLFANDIDKQNYDMYRARFGDTKGRFLLGDVRAIPAERVPTVTLATASFPRNSLSLVDKESSAFRGFARILEEMGQRRPPLVLLESAPGFLTSHGGSDIEQVLLTLNRLGYGVDAFMLNAARFGPQSQPRLFIAGVRDDNPAPLQNQQTQEPAHSYESDARPRALAAFIQARPYIRWVVRDLPPPPTSDGVCVDIGDIGDAVGAPAIAWIAEYYLNPIVSELMRGRVLRAGARR
jgi:DNA mismatch endonuclease Vsr